MKFLTVERLKRAELRRRAKIGRKPSNCGRNMVIFQFFQDAVPPPSWIFKISIFVTVIRLKRVELRRHAKFGRNRSNRGREMVIFQFFKMAAAAAGFLKFEIFNGRAAQEGRTASPCQIWSKSFTVLNELKECLIAVWSDFRQDIIDSAIDQ